MSAKIRASLWVVGLVFFLALSPICYIWGKLEGEMEATASNLRISNLLLKKVTRLDPSAPVATIPIEAQTLVIGNATWIDSAMSKYPWIKIADRPQVEGLLIESEQVLSDFARWKGDVGGHRRVQIETTKQLLEEIDKVSESEDQSVSDGEDRPAESCGIPQSQ